MEKEIKYWPLKKQNKTKMLTELRLRNPDIDQFIR